MRAVLTGALAALALAAPAGCGNSSPAPGGEATLTIYVSSPLSGPVRSHGNDIADGARLALADAGERAGGFEIAARHLDAAERDEDQRRPRERFDPVAAARNARIATEDSTTIAYIGELDSGATRSSLPITNSAGILQVAPGSGASDLVTEETYNDEIPSEVQGAGERTFAQLLPTYEPGERSRPLEVSELPPAGQELARRFEREYGRQPGPYAAYGYEAMASVLAAIDRADDAADRASVVDAYLDGPERDSVLGAYSITETGESTLG